MAFTPNVAQYHLRGVLSPYGFFSSRFRHRLFAVVYPRGRSNNLCPIDVLLTPLPLNTPTLQDARSAIMAFEMNMALYGRGAGINLDEQVLKFCFLEPAESAGPAPFAEDPRVTEFVGNSETENVAKFADYAVSYLVQHGTGDQVAEYNNIMSTKTEAQIANLDSVRIWQMITLENEIRNALVVEDPIPI